MADEASGDGSCGGDESHADDDVTTDPQRRTDEIGSDLTLSDLATPSGDFR